MSVQPSYEPECAATGGAVELTIEPRVRSLGEFDVRRVLPAAKRRMVGPFVFFDHMGPAVFPPGKGIAVRPHRVRGARLSSGSVDDVHGQ